MAIFAGLDVSAKTTHLYAISNDGAIHKRDVIASGPHVPSADPCQLANDG